MLSRMIKYTIIIDETIGPTSGKGRGRHVNYPIVKRTLLFPLDSKGKHIRQALSRATRELLYGLADYGYLDAATGIGDLYWYEKKENGD